MRLLLELIMEFTWIVTSHSQKMLSVPTQSLLEVFTLLVQGYSICTHFES